MCVFVAKNSKNFNSRPSARGDHAPLPKLFDITEFQFTPLREGRPQISDFVHPGIYFNSRPSARGDMNGLPGVYPPGISIHAPPRGATQRRRSASRKANYFNSRPSARGDRKRYAISANLLFNPYKSAWLNNRATQFVEIILVIFHRIIA